ncbi:hypothetical protein CB0940_09503 [Cercospora beticola]|uniref:Uncharacterized protein n=1 Tax=Cercospora beticola TaxID=122368 RepID=A0A2G5HG16_CERBT|nr:hypothetical protein CB0940_09503 [Cercospora beticola]PIA91478.1 hypothetical protein CB0940_09503 [Cercospora beticola]WPB06179.1 hypothetical protein RHO25_010836 [Cercospora beticola]CAK1366062.1 unnamed protein product [Cercospora beticola]
MHSAATPSWTIDFTNDTERATLGKKEKTEFINLFKHNTLLSLGVPMEVDQVKMLRNIYYNQGIKSVLAEVRQRKSPMPKYVQNHDTHTKLDEADRIAIGRQMFSDDTWREKELLPGVHEMMVKFEPNLQEVLPENLPNYFEDAFSMRTACWPIELLMNHKASGGRYPDSVYGRKKGG